MVFAQTVSISELYDPDDAVQLLVRRPGSSVVERLGLWEDYTITVGVGRGDSAMHSFKLTFAGNHAQLQTIGTTGGALVEVLVDGAPQFKGIIQEVSRANTTSDRDAQLTGRSFLGLLQDAVIPFNRLNLRGATVSALVNRWVAPWVPDYIADVKYDAAAARYIMAGGKVGSKPGSKEGTIGKGSTLDTRSYTPPGKSKARKGRFGIRSPAYRGTQTDAVRRSKLDRGTKVLPAIQSLAEQTGVMVWESPDGDLLLTRPTYNFDRTVYGEGIVLKYDSRNNRATGSDVGDVMEARLDTSIAERSSEYRIRSSNKPSKSAYVKQMYSTQRIKDPSPAFWTRSASAPHLTGPILHRPGYIEAKGIYSNSIISRIARRAMIEKALGGFSLTYMMRGHYSKTGHLWTPDTMVSVDDDVNGIKADMYIHQVERRFDQSNGRYTVLHLIPPDLWLGQYDTDKVDNDTFERETMNRIWW
jgi:prophage tail gpP-like protein